MAQFGANSINQFVKDMRSTKKSLTADKFSDDPKYVSLKTKYDAAVLALKENPSGEKEKTDVRVYKKMVNNYVDKYGTSQELSAKPLVNLKGDRETEINNCLELAYSMAMSFSKRSNDRICASDMVGYAMEGLVEAGRRYFSPEGQFKSAELAKQGKDAKFSTYAKNWIMNKLMAGVAESGSMFGGSQETKKQANKESKFLREQSEEDDSSKLCMYRHEMAKMSVAEHTESVSIEDDTLELRKYLQTVFKPLTKYEKHILFLYFGIDQKDKKSLTVEEIGERMNVHKSTISRDLAKAHAKMKKQANNRLDGHASLHLSYLLLGCNNIDLKIDELSMTSTFGFIRGEKLSA